jgi:hypothetical protein
MPPNALSGHSTHTLVNSLLLLGGLTYVVATAVRNRQRLREANVDLASGFDEDIKPPLPSEVGRSRWLESVRLQVCMLVCAVRLSAASVSIHFR